ANVAEEKRGFANSLLDAASKLGPVLSTAVGALVVERFGWRPLFLALGCISFCWLVPWMYSRPQFIDSSNSQAPQSVPLIAVVRCRQLWSTSAGTFALGYVWTFLLSWLPMYLVNQRGFTLRQVALLGSLPFAAMALAT